MRVNVMPTATQTRKFVPALFAILCALAPLSLRAQTTAKEPKDGGTITGRVIADGHGIADVLVVLMPTDFTRERRPVARAKTDADGHYQLLNVPPGSYYLNATTPVYISADGNPSMGQQGRLLNIT